MQVADDLPAEGLQRLDPLEELELRQLDLVADRKAALSNGSSRDGSLASDHEAMVYCHQDSVCGMVLRGSCSLVENLKQEGGDRELELVHSVSRECGDCDYRNLVDGNLCNR